MNLRHIYKTCLIAAMVTLGANFEWERAAVAQDDQAGIEEGVEVLTRGPVHEAFAATVTFDPQPGIVVPKAPPDAIEELPPDQRPEGANVAWIPGYWAWDDERDDFLWVSGIWRALPPGRQWVPGYWGQVGQDIQWISGYWADAELSEVRYLPEPPATVEAGPNIAAPSPDYIWAPGCWMWNQNRYAWRPGYWVPAQQNWIWIPACYQWSPRGYVFVDGYYDYSIARRGVLFAPVYFNPRVYSRQGFRYSPAFAISMAVFSNQLFLRPNYGHYYFGDYYASNYSAGGFYPWFAFSSGRYGYDPFYAQQRWQNRQNPRWGRTLQADFQHRVDHEDARPSRTLVAQQTRLKSGDVANEKNLVVATSLDQMAKSQDSSLKFQAVTKEEQQSLAKRGQDVQQFRVERQKLELSGPDTSTEKPAKGSEPARTKLPKSPIAAKSSDQAGEDQAPPKAQEAPESDLNVEPKPRKAGVQVRAPKREAPVPNADPRPESPKGKPKVEPKPAPKSKLMPAPKAEPKDEPKPAPKVKPIPAPKVEPKPEPKVEPKPAPKVKPLPPPKVEPKPAPKVEPKPEPRPEEPKDKPRKGKDKPKQ